jgi:DNA invertase Pin-like site-specific DNA recombinase
MKAAIYNYAHDPEKLALLERFCARNGYEVAFKMSGPENLRLLLKRAQTRQYQVLVVHAFSDLGSTTFLVANMIRDLALANCDVVTPRGQGLEGIQRPHVVRVIDALMELRKFAFAKRSQRLRALGRTVGRAASSEIASVKNGMLVATYLQSEKPLPIREIADRAGVAPGTVMRIKKLLAQKHLYNKS